MCTRKLKALAGDGVEVKEVSCIGRCDAAPMGMINHEPVPIADIDKVKEWVARPETVPHFDQPPPSRWMIDPYPTPESRYGAFRKLVGMARADGEAWALAELKASGRSRHGRGRVPRRDEVGAGQAGAAVPEVRHLQRRRERAGHVQGREDPGGCAAPDARRDDARRVHARRGNGDRLPSPRVRGGTKAAASGDRRRIRRGAARQEHPRDRRQPRHLDLRLARRLHPRRGDRASRSARGQARRAAEQAARSPARTGCTASRRSSTTSRRSPTSRPSS